MTPDQVALVMGRHYNRTKKDHRVFMLGNDHRNRPPQKEENDPAPDTSHKLAADYGVSELTIQRAGKFAAAVETLKARYHVHPVR